MSQVKVSGNASGTGVFEIAAPNTNTSYTLTLPQATTTLVGTDATQTLTNKTISGAVMQSMASSVITSGTAVASTSGTSIDFTGIPSWVKRITVMFNGVSTSGTSFKQLQLGTASGIVNTGYLSYSCKLGVSGVSNGQNYTAGIGMSSNLAAEILSGSFTISLQGSNVWCVNGLLADSSSSVGIPVTGAKTLSDTLTQIRITTVNGTDTFDAGSINILYE